MKAGGPAMVTLLTALIQSCLVNGTITEYWKRGIISPLYKGKGSRNAKLPWHHVAFLPGETFCSNTP